MIRVKVLRLFLATAVFLTLLGTPMLQPGTFGGCVPSASDSCGIT